MKVFKNLDLATQRDVLDIFSLSVGDLLDRWFESAPLKAWGNVLVKQGNTKEALKKFDAALKYAPNWKELKQAREAVAKTPR